MATSTTCSACGATFAEGALYCQNCATPREDPNTRALFVVDGTTGLFNSTFTAALVDHETSRAVRYHRPLTILVGIVDHVEFIQQDLGEAKAIELFRELGDVLSHAIRDIDTVGFLGDRFCFVLPETDQSGAMVAAEKIMHAVAANEFAAGAGQWGRLTLSLGSASVNPDRMGRQDLVATATQALLEGRQDGSNRVHLANAMI